MTSTPHISVIVPSFNHRPYLPERMESILNQTRQDFELILLDDASQDGSAEYLETFLDRPGVRFVRNSQNSGSPFAQWNRGLQEAKGDLIWIAESDDIACPQFLEVVAGILDQDESIGLAFCRSNRIDEEGMTISAGSPALGDRSGKDNFRAAQGDAVSEYLYLNNSIVSASAVVFRRRIYEAVGMAETSFRLVGDWMQWCKILTVSDLYYVAQPLSGTRIHSNTRRHSTASDGTLELESLSVQKRIRNSLNVDRAIIRNGAERVTRSWLQGMRAGRFSGSLLRHPLFLWRVLRADSVTGVRFALSLPYAFLVWLVKRFVAPKRYLIP
jgi:glycosyltransferase involved in cell wall biosynthesis